MRRNATKVAAAVLSLAVTMTSVNLPTTAAAATKKVKLNKTKATLRVGKTTTLKVTKGGKKVKATFTSNKKKIATVGKNTGKVKAKKKGTATITAKYAGKKYKCKITVKKKATPTKPTVAPTTAPTAVPTTAPTAVPTEAPSAAPTTAPTAAPTATAAATGTIATASAIGPNQIQVKFNGVAPTNAVVKLTNASGTEVATDQSWDEGRTTLTLTSKSNAGFALDTYSVTVTVDGKEVDKKTDIKIERQKVQEIKITSKVALTSSDRRSLYVYYDVLDQYGTSMRKSANIVWSSSTGRIAYDDKDKGCLTLKKAVKNEKEDPEFVYNDPVKVIGVDSVSGVSGQSDDGLRVSMAQALAKIKFEGFVSKYDSKLRQKLPKDFAANRYYLLYTAYDQEGKELDVADYTLANNSSGATFTTANIDLINSDLRGDKPIKVGGKEYCAIAINPGMSVDKGGKITIKSIARMTGGIDEGTFEIESGRRLQSLVIHAPNQVADGDKVTLDYTATDDKGETTTNYETIVRSSNKLRLVASDGKLKIEEDADGKAKITWEDSISPYDFGNASANDNTERNISLTTMVTNGDAPSITRFNVSDARRPVAVSDVKLNDDNDKDIIAEANTANINLFDGSDVKYIDQYNRELDGNIAKAFFAVTSSYGNQFDGNIYGLYVDYTSVVNDANTYNDVININIGYDDQRIWKSHSKNTDDNYIGYETGTAIFVAAPIIKNSDNPINPYKGFTFRNYENNGSTAKEQLDNVKNQTNLKIKTNESSDSDQVRQGNIKYYVVKISKNGNNSPSNSGGWTYHYVAGSNSGSNNTAVNMLFGDLSEDNKKLGTVETLPTVKDIQYTVVPVRRLSDLKINDLGRLRIQTKYSEYQNGQDMHWQDVDADTKATTRDGEYVSKVENSAQRKVSVCGYYNGAKVTIPNTYFGLNPNEKTDGSRDHKDTFTLKVDGKDTIIDGINRDATTGAAIKYRDLYDFNQAKNLRRVASKDISINIYDMTTDFANDNKKSRNIVETLTTSVEVSDAARSPEKIYFVSKDDENKVLDKLTFKAKVTELFICDDYNNEDKTANVFVKVVDQYGDNITKEPLSNIYDSQDAEVKVLNKVVYRVEGRNEVPAGDSETLTTIDNKTVYAHLPNSFEISKNNTKCVEIVGAEIKDTFNLTANIKGTSIYCTVPVTMEADELAYIDSTGFDEGRSTSDDLRSKLGYNR